MQFCMQQLRTCLQAVTASGVGLYVASLFTLRLILRQFAHARMPVGRDPALIWTHWKDMGIV